MDSRNTICHRNTIVMGAAMGADYIVTDFVVGFSRVWSDASDSGIEILAG